MSNRTGNSDVTPRCSNTDTRGVCMYIGPCFECWFARAKVTSRSAEVAVSGRSKRSVRKGRR